MTGWAGDADSTRLADRIEALRDQAILVPNDAGPVLNDLRLALETLHAEVSALDGPPLDEALGRLALMVEVWECLDAADPVAVAELPAFFAESLDRLAVALREGPSGTAADWVLGESARHWGDYLALLDPSWGPTGTADPLPSDPVEPGPEPEIDVSELLRQFGAEATPRPAETKLPAPEPRATPDEPSTATDSAFTDSTLSDPIFPDSVAQAPALGVEDEVRDLFLADLDDLFGTCRTTSSAWVGAMTASASASWAAATTR